MLRYSILDRRTGRRLARVALAWRERAALACDGDGSLLAGDLPARVRELLCVAGASPARRRWTASR